MERLVSDPSGRSPHEVIEASDPPLTAGSCILRRADIAEIVQAALLHFESDRYFLLAWCIMPNHVHAVVKPNGDITLSAILQSWKSFTANQINRLLNRHGPMGERESFDHLIRSAEDLDRFIHYTGQNPVVAGFVSDPAHWPFSHCGAGFHPVPVCFTDPRSVPFVHPRSRGELPHLEKDSGTYFVTFRLLDAVKINQK